MSLLVALTVFCILMVAMVFFLIKPRASKIDNLYRQAFEQNDFKALLKLAHFSDSRYTKSFQKSSLQATEIFKGTQYLLHRLEAEGAALLCTKKQLEKGISKDIEFDCNMILTSYYDNLGEMYDTGFGCVADKAKAKECCEKAEKYLKRLDDIARNMEIDVDNLQKPN